jgi:hypothetical protein
MEDTSLELDAWAAGRFNANPANIEVFQKARQSVNNFNSSVQK